MLETIFSAGCWREEEFQEKIRWPTGNNISFVNNLEKEMKWKSFVFQPFPSYNVYNIDYYNKVMKLSLLKSLSEQLQATNEPCILVVCLFSNILHAFEKQNHKFNLGTTKNWTVLKIWMEDKPESTFGGIAPCFQTLLDPL